MNDVPPTGDLSKAMRNIAKTVNDAMAIAIQAADNGDLVTVYTVLDTVAKTTYNQGASIRHAVETL